MRLSKRWAPAALLLLVPLIGGTDATASPIPLPGQSRVPVERSAEAVPGQYIVTLKPAFSSAGVLRQLGIKALFTYETVLSGFAATLTPGQLGQVRALPGVAAVEENGVVSVDPALAASKPASASRTTSGSRRARVTPGSWGQDRIDQRYLPLDNDYDVTGTGKGVSAYIVDTGIETGHSEFGGRATVGLDTVDDGRNGQDCNGHGTHVAGTTGGATYGVARSVSLVAVRVLNCKGNGDWAGVIAGFDWVAKHAKKPAVLNASLGGPSSTAVDAAANAVTAAGVLPVVAAGNDHKDACTVSPAGAEQVIAVGATDIEDHEAKFSNYGKCLWTYAPGVAIVSAKLGGGSVALNGTSMASPHVAGVAALYKEKHPDADPKSVALWIARQSTKYIVSPIGADSPNRLLYTDGL
ncbi:S8 family peptidase [Streptomyces sp. NPDC088116]|uniref:S8 family peptidase n=1 Tax=Streptomyces sp. NPDC088116 TaxID=3365825 RepID=UPI0038251699